MAEKNIIGGMDTGGGVGFGIPADYSGSGVQEADPDPVIAEHNQLAEKRLSRLISPTRNVITSSALSESYSNLPEQSPIRRRAVEFEQAYLAIQQYYRSAEDQLERQKSVASKLLDVANAIASEVRQKGEHWDESSQKMTNLAHLEEDYEKALSSWVKQVENILSSHGDIKLWNVSPKMSHAFLTLASVDLQKENPFTSEKREFDHAVHAFDESVDELHHVSEHGGGGVLSQYQDAKVQHDEIKQGLDQMTEDVKRATRLYHSSGAKKAGHMKWLDPAMQSETTQIDFNGTEIPDFVPGYRQAIETSPRVCGSCMFFEGKQGSSEGHCTSFDFTAKANYVCDAWQAQALTSVHTAMRDEGRHRKDADSNWQEPVYSSAVYEKDGTPKQIQGRVRGEVTGEESIHNLEFETTGETNYSTPSQPEENAALRHISKKFVPGDVVYSKSLRTLAVVQDVVSLSGNKVYGLKLIDNKGGSWGTGVSYGDDLQPRSKSAVKRVSKRSIKSDDIEQVIELTRSVYKALLSVVENYQDLTQTPLSNKEVLTPLQQDMLRIMEDPVFDNVTTGRKRKYFRALQDATYSVGASRQVIFEGFRRINTLKQVDPEAKSAMRDIMTTCQKTAYDRLKTALKHVEDALTLPSVTHDDPPPGLKVYFDPEDTRKGVAEGMLELISANVTHDNIKVEADLNDDDEMGFTVTKQYSYEDGDVRSAVDEITKQVEDLEEMSNVRVDVEDAYTEKTKTGSYTASVKFYLQVE